MMVGDWGGGIPPIPHAAYAHAEVLHGGGAGVAGVAVPVNVVGEGGPQIIQVQGLNGRPIRRIQLAIRLDLMLLFKLALAVFLFNQDGSLPRLVVLSFLAILFYLSVSYPPVLFASSPAATWNHPDG